MKKVLLMAAFAGLLFASCSSNQSTETVATTTDSTAVTVDSGATVVADTAKVDTTATQTSK